MSRLLIYILMLAALTSCGADAFLDRRDLIDDYGSRANVRLDVDWMTHFKSKPTGMTVMLYPDEGARQEDETNDVESMTLNVERGRHRLLLFNLTRGEYGSMRFYGIDNYDSLRVQLTPMQSTKAWDDTISYRHQPEPFGVATDTMMITPQMVDESHATGDTIVFHETPMPITTTVSIKVHIGGLDNARSVAGAVSGIADGYLLTAGHAMTTGGTQQLSNWQAKRDSVGNGGYISTTITTFGLPYREGEVLENRGSMANVLTLFFNLRDGKSTRLYRLPIGNKFHYTTDGSLSSRTIALEVTLDSGITLPDVTPDGNKASGFDAVVDKWEDGETVDVGF